MNQHVVPGDASPRRTVSAGAPEPAQRREVLFMDMLTIHITLSSLWRLLILLGVSLASGLLLSLAYQAGSSRDEQSSLPFAWLLVIMPSLISVIIFMVEDNFLRALYLLGATTIIRFRNPVKYPLNTILVLATVAAGAAAGFGFHLVSLMLALLCFLFLFIDGRFIYRQRRHENRVLHLSCHRSSHPDQVFRGMGKWLRRWTKLSIESAGASDHLSWCYQVQLRKGVPPQELVGYFQRHGITAHILEPRDLQEF
jgi:hypothetical protein